MINSILQAGKLPVVADDTNNVDIHFLDSTDGILLRGVDIVRLLRPDLKHDTAGKHARVALRLLIDQGKWRCINELPSPLPDDIDSPYAVNVPCQLSKKTPMWLVPHRHLRGFWRALGATSSDGALWDALCLALRTLPDSLTKGGDIAQREPVVSVHQQLQQQHILALRLANQQIVELQRQLEHFLAQDNGGNAAITATRALLPIKPEVCIF